MLKLTRENIHSENLTELQDSFVEKMREKRKEFDSQMRCEHLSLGWDDGVLDAVRKLGVLNTVDVYGMYDTPVVDYTDKVKPVVNTGAKGNGKAEFLSPRGVSIDYKTGNIYVVDELNHRVQVFDSEGEYLYKFGDVDGVSKMNNPLCIAISNDRVLVSQGSGRCLLVFDLEGNFIRQVGSKGKGKLQFNLPLGLAVNELNGDIYVCDFPNNRVQIISKVFSYKSQFVVEAPRDIKLTTQHIHVLAQHEPFLFTFDYHHTQVLQNMSISIGNHLENPFALCIDGTGKFLISDINKNLLLIFDRGGNYLHQLKDPSIKSPLGIAIDKKGRVVLMSHKPCLLIF